MRERENTQLEMVACLGRTSSERRAAGGKQPAGQKSMLRLKINEQRSRWSAGAKLARLQFHQSSLLCWGRGSWTGRGSFGRARTRAL